MAVAAKICGINDPAALDAALRHGARMVGFNSFAKSPRYVTPDQAAQLAARVPEEIERVGVMVDPTDAELERFIRAGRLTVVQLHGYESPARVAAIRETHGVKAMKVIRVATPEDLEAVAAFEPVADLLMFDAKPPREATRPGGNAVAFDWRVLAGRTWRRPWLLSGGIDAANVAKAVEITGARTVDVASGVEDRPGVKSAAKIREFLEVARGLV